MADSAIPISAGTGTNVDTRTQSGGDHRQVMVLGDAVDTNTASVFGAGFLRVTAEPHQVFYDPFDTAPDTTNLWTPTNAGGGVAAAVTAGVLTVGSGTTTAGYSKITSIPTFKPTVPSWIGYSFAISMTDLAAPTAQTYRFWGAGTTPGSPTAAAPLTDAIGFELDIAGKMYAVVYINGTRTQIQDLSAATGNSTQPTNTSTHRYGVYYRTDRSYFFIDTLDNVVATTAFQSPAVQTLPVTLLAVAGTTPGSSGVISCTGLAVWDTGANAHQLSDGTYPFRKAQVGSSGGLSVKGAALTGLTGDNAISGTSTIGPLNIGEAGNVTFIVKNKVAASAWTGAPVIVFEQSDDSTSWAPMPVTRADNGAVASTHTLPAGAANVEYVFNTMAPSITYVRARFTTGQTGNIITVSIQGGGLAFMPSVSALSPPAVTSALTQPALSASSFTVLAANAARKQAIFFNDSGNVLYLAFAATASTTAYTVQIAPGAYYDMPSPVYNGLVTGISAVASGNVRVTELS